ncbi:MAG: flavodoxin family protein [Clostridia bacterium]|nr:flavodoxin family protein [Clostridia bacterium]
MKLLLINTSPHAEGATDRALSIAAEEWNRLGGESEIFFCKSGPTFSCIACGLCKHGDGCFYQDAVNELRPLCKTADAFIFASPVHYGGASATAKSVMGRLLRSSGDLLRKKPAFAVAIGRRAGHIGTLCEMEKFFAFNEMPIATSNYFTILRAGKREDVDADTEGVGALKLATKNLFWLADLITKDRNSAKG